MQISDFCGFKIRVQMQIAPSTYRRITLIALVALIVIIITGGVVRLTDSGLGCPDWPTCEGDSLVPDRESEAGYHALIEFVNRAITGITAVAVALAVLGAFWLKSLAKNIRRNLLFWAGLLVVGVLVQVILGALVVWLHLTPPIVMAHFLVSMYLVYAAVVLHYKTSNLTGSSSRSQAVSLSSLSSARSRPYLIWLTRLGVLLAAAVIFAGTVLTGAGPHSGATGDEDETVRRFALDIPNLARIHAGLVIGFIGVMALGWLVLYELQKSQTEKPDILKRIWSRGKFLAVITLSQTFVGYVQYFSDVPEVLVGVHIAGAALLWTAVVYFYLEVCPPLKISVRQFSRQIAPSSS